MGEEDIYKKVLEDSAKSYLKVTTPQNIQTNPRGQKLHEINGKYPDVIVTMKTGEIVIEKIETESTVSQSQVPNWQELCALGHEFKLVVPLSKIEDAKALSTTVPNVNVQAYEVVGDQIHWFGQR